jgi:hypothetical protein
LIEADRNKYFYIKITGPNNGNFIYELTYMVPEGQYRLTILNVSLYSHTGDDLVVTHNIAEVSRRYGYTIVAGLTKYEGVYRATILWEDTYPPITENDKPSYFGLFRAYVRLGPRISISVSSSTSHLGFEVEIKGNLTFNGTGLSLAAIFLSYSVDGETWNDITLVKTDVYGGYSVVWMPSATGHYVLEALWIGNSTYQKARSIAYLAVTFKDQHAFSVLSNSTVSELAFNSTSKELSFTVTGLSGTTGYADVYVAKTLVGNILNIKAHIDGNELNHTVTELADSLVIHFVYPHSAHKVTVNLGTISFIETPTGKVILYGIPITVVTVAVALYLFKRRRKEKPSLSNVRTDI